MKEFRSALLASMLVFLMMAPAMGQGCALCYTQAAGAGEKMIAALKSGILVLVFPPMGICALLTWMGYKKRNHFHALESEDIQATQERGPNADLGW